MPIIPADFVCKGEIAIDGKVVPDCSSEEIDALQKRVAELERMQSQYLQTQADSKYLELIFQTMPVGAMMVDTDMRITSWTKGAERLTGLKEEDVLGKKCTEIWRCDTCENGCGLFTDNLNKPVRNKECHITTKARALTILKNADLLRDAQGRVIGGIEVFLDVAEWKHADKRIEGLNRLKEQLLFSGGLDRKLKLITDAVVNVFQADFARIWIIKPGDLCDSGCVHAGVTEGPHVCRFRDRCLHLKASSGRYTHIDGQTHRRVPFGCYKIGRVAAGQEAKFVTNDATSDPQVHNHDWARQLGLVSFAGYRLLSVSGEPIGVLALFSKHPISPDEDALLENVANTTSHIIQTARAEDATNEALRQWETTFNAAKDMIMLVDSEFNIVRANVAVANFLGKPLNRILGMKCYELMHNASAPPEICPLKKAMQTGKHEEAELCVPNKNIWITASIDPIYDDQGKITGAVHIIRDITELKAAAHNLEQLNVNLEKTIHQLSNANRELQDFLHIAAHDLKGTLRGIGTLAGWISSDYGQKLDQQGRERVNLLVGRAERMYRMIDAVLQYSEIGRMEENPVDVDFNQLVEEVVRQLAPPQNVTVTVREHLPRVRCGEESIKVVLQNLLENALKYMDKPTGLIEVGCTEEDGYWRFSVTDNGPGIEEKYFDKIFRVFQTLAPRDETETTGIGLAVVKKIVEMHGGRVSVKSRPGVGSTFSFTLPRAEMGVQNTKLKADIAR